MDKRLLDLDQVTHVHESGIHHNTFCGELHVHGKIVEDDAVPVTCLACLGGPSHTTIEDLVDADDVVVLMVGLDANGRSVTSMVPVTFSQGRNATPVAWRGLPENAIVNSIAYCRRDHRVLHVTKIEPIVVTSSHSLEIDVGGVQLSRAK